MQGTKLPRAKLWIAGVSTVAILLGCEAQPVKEQAANSNKARQSRRPQPIQGAARGSRKKPSQATWAPQAAAVIPDAEVAQGGAQAPAPRLARSTSSARAAERADYMTAPAAHCGCDGRSCRAGATSSQPIPGEGENYIATTESPVKQAAVEQVSTFSIDVDTGAYSNVRRFLMNGQMPPRDAVRVEEMINYFSYDYPGPEAGGEPFRVTTAVERTPWNAGTYLLHVGIKGFEPPAGERPAANLVFLVDVSGSMDQPDKLPLAAGRHENPDRPAARRRQGHDRGLCRRGRPGAGADRGQGQGEDQGGLGPAAGRRIDGGRRGPGARLRQGEGSQDRRRHQPHHPGDRRRLQCRRHRYRTS